MDGSLFNSHAPSLRAIADSMRLEPVSLLARRPGVQDVYRITVHYYDRRACDSVATLCKSITGGVTLDIVYRRALDHKPLTYRISDDRFRAFVAMIQRVRFDKLIDQPTLPVYDSTDLWMIERAAGTFSKSVILAPATVDREPYKLLIDAVRNNIPEALRQVK